MLTLYQKQLRSRLRAGTGPATLGSRSQNYRRKVNREEKVRGLRFRGAVFVNLTGPQGVPYAAIHEGEARSQIVRAKRAKVLTIPVVGSPAQPSRHRPPRPIQLFTNGFWVTSRKGTPLFVFIPGKSAPRGGRRRRRGRRPSFAWPLAKGVGGQVLFVGLKSIRIPKRPVWATTFVRQTPRVLRRFEIGLDRALATVGGS